MTASPTTVSERESSNNRSLGTLLGLSMETKLFLELAIKITAALEEIHRQRIVHKDISPSCILVDQRDNTVSISGFSVTSTVPYEYPSFTIIQNFKGSLAYISPEQTGRMNRVVDYRSDLYSLGVIFYEMLTGTLPFQAVDALGWVHCHIARLPKPPIEILPHVPAPLSEIIMRLLAKTAEERYQTAYGLRFDLEKCREQWRPTATMERFSLGEKDVSEQLLIPQTLYGREKDITTLQSDFERVIAQGAPEMAVVTGYSGIGKSSLVRELYKPVARAQGFFSSGKFDQYKRDIPYLTISEAFRGLIQQLLTEREELVSEWRERFKTALGNNAQLIIGVIPQFELIIGPQQPVSELPPSEAHNRFNMVFRQFIGVFTQKQHPLTLFLDDLQWADPASLRLIEYIITHAETRYLLLVGAYRDNEVDPSHPLILTLDDIRKSDTRFSSVTLSPLSRNDLDRMLADSFRSTVSELESLTTLVYLKTIGNPFFTIQFLMALHSEHLVEFDRKAGRWRWDIIKIQAQGFTDNVVDLVVSKMRRLSSGAQEILKLAACIGNRFDLDALAAIGDETPENIKSLLMKTMHEGLVLLEAEQTYAFLHDRVQQGAYSLIPDSERQDVHLRIGRLMLERSTPSEIEERVFDIVHQLNMGSALIENGEEKYQVAGLNLLAGRKAMASTAYTAALNYFSTGTLLLGDDAWEHHFDLAFFLYRELAVTEYLNSNYVHSKELIIFLLSKADSDLERARLHNILIVQYTLTADYGKAIQSGREALRILGITVPETDLTDELNSLLTQNSEIIGERKIASLLDDPAMTDPEKVVSLELLSNMVVPARYTDSTLFALVTVLNVNISLRFGLTPKSTVGYTAYGMVLNSVMGQYKEAFEFGELSLKLSERFNALAQKCQACFMVGHYLNHWVRHLKLADDTLHDGIKAGLASGEMQWTGYIFAYKLFQPFYRGVPLNQIRAEIPGLLFFTRKTKNQWATDTLLGLQLALYELENTGPPPECGNEEQFFSSSQEHRSFGAKGRYAVLKAEFLYLSGCYQEALEAVILAKELQGFYSSSISVAALNFYHSLILSARHETVSEEEQQNCRTVILENQRQLRIWADNCPDNFNHLFLLVEAELARLAGNNAEGQNLYEQAIHSAAKGDFIRDEAIAYELASRFYRDWGFTTTADAYLREARNCYLRWGGMAKVKQLDRGYPGLMVSEHSVPTLRANTSIGQLDAITVIKASQAISGNIHLPDLIDSLMRIVVENAGAERGCLILIFEDNLSIAATAKVTNTEITVQHEVTPFSESELPVSLINYVKRTRENIILDDASGNTLFSKDPYFTQTRQLSVLCLPIIKQSTLIGLLYLENNLTTGAFTPDRIAVLEMLASQAAISLENATLYLERGRAEDALRASEEQYRAIFENNGTALIFIEEDTTISLCNKEFEKLYGAGKDEIEGCLKWTEIVARPDDLRRMQDYHHMRRSDKGDAPQTYEFQMITRAGELRDIVISVTIMPGTRQSMASLLDITERRQAEVALQEKAERIQLLLNSTGEGIYGVDLEGRCTFINPAAIRLLGFDSPEEFLGNNMHALIHHTRRDGTPYPKNECRIFQAFHTGVPIKINDEVLWRRDGSSFPVEYESHPVRNAGTVVGAVCTFHDITERKQAEEKIVRMATIIEHAAEGIILTDTNWVIQYANPAFERITGYDADEVIGQRTGILKSDSHDSLFYKNIRETMFRGEVWSGRLVNKKKDGTLYEVEASGSPVRDESGTITGFIGIQHDITNEIRLERQLRQTQKMEAIGTLAGGIAHDFNNILTAILGYAQIMAIKLPQPSPLGTYLEQILKASYRATDLVKQILTFSRQTEQERKPVQISLIAEEVLKLIRSSLPATVEIYHKFTVAPLEDYVLADSTQIHQVLMNLCTNAGHAMYTHGGVMSLEISPFQVDSLMAPRHPRLHLGPHIKLVVSDTGHGMDSATMERIFDPYFTTKAPGEGTGLGLSVVQGIIKSHNGDITVYSEPGKGSSFTIILPCIDSASNKSGDTTDFLPKGNEHILFVDDEKTLIELGRDILEHLGYTVTARHSSVEALDIFTSRPESFDLLITDLTMPGLTGEELALQIRAIRSDIPILLYTGFIREGLLEQARAAGIKEVRMKPYEVRSMATIVREMIDTAKERDEK